MHTLIVLLLVGVAAAGLAPLLKHDEVVKGQYIIKFKDDLDVDTVADDIERSVQKRRLGRADISHRYHRALKGMAAKLSDEAVKYIRTLDEVEYVAEDGLMHATNIPWGLDRIGQRDMPLDGSFSPNSKYKQGAGVQIWVLDTGIRPTHIEFGGRAVAEYDAYGGNGLDCHGHGTHCAGVAAGAVYGVAKQARIFGVKVLGFYGCDGSGAQSAIIDGLEYVIKNAKKPAVVSMSLGGYKYKPMEDAITNVLYAGIPVVVAAGNSNADACQTSPAFMVGVITVGSSDKYDYRSYFSNWGDCVNVFAPGSDIPSAYWPSDDAVQIMSGTSMACPHVAGMAALYLAADPSLTPDTIRERVYLTASLHKLTNPGPGSRNLLAYIDP